MTDPIADLLNRMRNALAARKSEVTVPSSKLKVAVAQALKNEGFIEDFDVVKDRAAHPVLRVRLRYHGKRRPAILGLRRVSTPGLRVYSRRRSLPRVYRGLGVALVSTSRGLMSDREAWKQGLGGEVICYVW
ncbi:MAG: 30S ribosomal protein S8 [SAR202 cluster bacterium]|nr:30S ribosomal protein S8 [SAR202 cluster bacterium]